MTQKPRSKTFIHVRKTRALPTERGYDFFYLVGGGHGRQPQQMREPRADAALPAAAVIIGGHGCSADASSRCDDLQCLGRSCRRSARRKRSCAGAERRDKPAHSCHDCLHCCRNVTDHAPPFRNPRARETCGGYFSALWNLNASDGFKVNKLLTQTESTHTWHGGHIFSGFDFIFKALPTLPPTCE